MKEKILLLLLRASLNFSYVERVGHKEKYFGYNA